MISLLSHNGIFHLGEFTAYIYINRYSRFAKGFCTEAGALFLSGGYP